MALFNVSKIHFSSLYERLTRSLGYITVPHTRLARIPDQLNDASACPILCAGVTAYTALKKMKPERGKWCAISGAAGGLGHLAIQYAKKVFGLNVIAIDGGSEDKQKFCVDMGCDEYVDFIQEGHNLAKEVRRRTGGGAHYVLIFSPSQSAYEYACPRTTLRVQVTNALASSVAGDYARFGAEVMAVGIGPCQ